MGRPAADTNAYQVKSAVVDLAVPGTEDAEFTTEFTRSQRSVSENDMAARPTEETSYMPQTPSPFMHPAACPDPNLMPYPIMENAQFLGPSALAFGDFTPEDGASMAYNCIEQQGYGPTLYFDPNTGTYMAYEYAVMPYDNTCYMVDPSQMQMIDRGPEEHTQVLLNALSEKIGEDQIQVSDPTLEPNNGAVEAMEVQVWDGDQGWDEGAGGWGHNKYDKYGTIGGGFEGGGYDVAEEPAQAQPGRRRTERREAREIARRQDRAAAAAAAISADGQGCSEDGTGRGAAWGAEATQSAKSVSGAITTVMFRNIPNKYTREMLVKQLEHDMMGQFDFVYLPIDFKNKCNVGYAFINFRSVEACETFVNRFNGVEVRKCLPGLNSRKVTEVTPARVQGFDDNVQRLRNSPVMRELVHKPEWMPLIFDGNGKQLPFPNPERPLEPIKPRRRARDDEAMRFS